MRSTADEKVFQHTLETTSNLNTPSSIPGYLPDRLNGTVIPMGRANVIPSGPKLTASPPASSPPPGIGMVAGT